MIQINLNDSEMTLEEYSRISVERFLKSVVLIDDQAYQKSSRFVAETEATHLETPVLPFDRFMQQPVTESMLNDATASVAAEPAPADDAPVLDDHALDGPQVIRNFAQKGILCSVLQPANEKREETLAEAVSLSAAADVVILDWELRRGDYSITLDIIKAILEQDSAAGGRLRLLVVYTAEKGRVVKRILLDELNDFQKGDGSPSTIYRDHTAIAILNKPTSSNTDGIRADQLPDTVVAAYAKLARGLLPSAALNAISIVRENTQQLLSQFTSQLDLAYVAHRALIPRPEDAEIHFIELMSDTLEQMLVNGGCTEALSATRCGYLLDSHDYISSWSDERRKVLDEQLLNFSESKRQNIKTAFGIDSGNDLGVARQFLEILHGRDDDPGRQNKAKLARQNMAALADFYRDSSVAGALKRPPRLSMGTVVARNIENEGVSNTEFYLCVQPRCDSLRFHGIRRFPFIRLSSENGTPNIHLKWNESVKLLSAGQHVYDLEMFEFGQDGMTTPVIEAEAVSGKWIFKCRNASELVWAGDLRKDKTLRFASKIASRLHMPGINDYEVTRISD